MSLNAAALVAKLAADGTDPQLLAEVAEALFKSEAALQAIEERRRKDRERKTVPQNSTELHGIPDDSEEIRAKEKTPTPPKEKPSPKENPPKGGQKKGVDAIGEAWNEIVAPHGLPSVRLPLAPERAKMAAAALKRYSLDEIRAALAEVPRNEHWMEKRWTDMFATFLRPGKIEPFVEAAENRQQRTPAKPLTTEELERAIRFRRDHGDEDGARKYEAELAERRAA